MQTSDSSDGTTSFYHQESSDRDFGNQLFAQTEDNTERTFIDDAVVRCYHTFGESKKIKVNTQAEHFADFSEVE